MKKYCSKKSEKNIRHKLVCLFIFLTLPTVLYSQDYRSLSAYMQDFAKNELFIKKSLMDYSESIVKSQLYSRTKATAQRIVQKLESINVILGKYDKGFKGNTMLRDSFVKMNEKTIECLQNGTLILNDYDYQSKLSLNEIEQNFSRKEKLLIAYYQELKNYEEAKKIFAMRYKMRIKSKKEKNILEYNAMQNILFYKMNVIDEKLSKLIIAKDKKGISDCFKIIELTHITTLEKTSELKFIYRDTSLNDANIQYSNFIVSQKEKISKPLYDYVDAYNILQSLKNSSKTENKETTLTYNNAVKVYNSKKNLFYAIYNEIQATRDELYENWLIINSDFIKNNGHFDSLYE